MLIQEGASNRTLYLVIEGQLTVSYRPPEGNENRVITKLGPGSIFGEFSMLTGEKASATVRAVGAGRLAALERGEIDLLANHFPALIPSLLASYRQRKQELLQHRLGQQENAAAGPPPATKRRPLMIEGQFTRQKFRPRPASD